MLIDVELLPLVVYTQSASNLQIPSESSRWRVSELLLLNSDVDSHSHSLTAFTRKNAQRKPSRENDRLRSSSSIPQNVFSKTMMRQ